jgi:hypothetical protein
LIVKLLTDNNSNTSELPFEQIWHTLTNTVPGKYNPQKPYEFWTNEYGPIYRNTLSQKIVDAFGAVRRRKNNGTVLIFDEEKIKKLKKTHEQQDQGNGKAEPKDAAPAMHIESKKEVTDTLEDKSEGSVSSEGYRVCGFIIE